MYLPDVHALSVPRAALVYVEAGIPIVPFDPTRGNGKECGNLVGGERDTWYRLCTTDKTQLRAWRQRFGSFVALATSPGAIACVVLDVDKPAKFPKPWRSYLEDQSVPYVNTRPSEHKRRGHYWFRVPDAGQIGNRGFEWGELRCVGGGLVLPPYPNDSRRVIRAGSPPTLPDELYVAVAGAGGSVAQAVNLDEFLNRHVTESKPYKLKGVGKLFDGSLTRTGSRHHAARIALTVGFGESRLGYVSAQKVYDCIRLCWDKSAREFDALASWCANVAESTDIDALKLKSDRCSGTDSRKYAGHFAGKQRRSEFQPKDRVENENPSSKGSGC